ncbi:SPOR domain-containing protein [Gilvimarinus chinensis]|uniref:SPOR domain-containing protein n=1 Tax=Gilvimarinus chinensis TaxID=396005 RepID=UPI000375FE04|nr:SPOR domain-containing protein [Gilvimarinus chinensis]
MNDGLKQRLIGALVLTGLAVIFLPGFFKEQQMHQVDTRSQIPPRPAVDPVVIKAPQPIVSSDTLPDPDTLFIPQNEQPIADDPKAHEQSLAEAQSSSSAQSSSIESASDSVATEQPVKSESLESTSSSAGKSPEALPELNAWVVQVASLRSADSAQALRKKLQNKGYKAYVRVAKTSQGEVSRVFIGPKVDKALAEAVKAEIDPAFKVNSLVLKFKP